MELLASFDTHCIFWIKKKTPNLYWKQPNTKYWRKCIRKEFKCLLNDF